MKTLYLFIALLFISATATAQFGGMAMSFPSGGTGASEVNIEKGDQRLLSGKKIQVIFVYDGMRVTDFGSEEEFINSMISHFEAKKPGRGIQWKHEWQDDKNGRFKQLFLDEFNDMAIDHEYGGHVQLDSAGADYQLIITTKTMYPGYEAWVTHDPALIDVVCDFRDKTGNTVLLVTMNHVPGLVFGSGNFDLNLRIGQCYEKLAKDLYKTISKKPKKKKGGDE